jgi:multiple sugar transport system permease protein
MTLPVGLSMMIIGDVVPWGELCAAALIMAIPVLILYTLGQKYMVGGLTAGAVKGGG